MKTKFELKKMTLTMALLITVTVNAGVIKSQTADTTDATDWVGDYRYYADNAGVDPTTLPVQSITSNGTIISNDMTAGAIQASDSGIGTINCIISKDLFTTGGELDAAGDKFATFTVSTTTGPHYLIAMQNDGVEDVFYMIEADDRAATISYEIRGNGTGNLVGGTTKNWRKLRANTTSAYYNGSSFDEAGAPDFTDTVNPVYYGFAKWTASSGAASVNSSGNSYTVSAMSLTVTDPAPQVYSSATCTQSKTLAFSGGTDQEIMGLEVVITDSEAPIYNLTGLELGTVGISQIDNIKIYSTGTSPTFATTTLEHTITSPIGTTQSILPAAGMSIALSEGTNYIWIAYDVKSTATTGTILDASCTQITVDNGTASNENPTPPAPTGELKVAEILVSCGFEPADNFPESTDGAAMPTTTDSLGNNWTFGQNAGHWDGFGSMPDNSQHLQFNPTTVNSYWQVELATQPTEKLKGQLSFDSAEGTSSTNIDMHLEGLSSNGWVQIGATVDYDGISPYQTFTFNIADISLFSDYRILFTNRQATSRVHFDNIQLLSVDVSDPQTYIDSFTNQPFTLIDAATTYSDELVMGLEVVMTGATTPDSLSGVSLVNEGTGSPSTVKIYSTGLSSTFDTAGGPIFTGTPAEATAATFTAIELSHGTNYFWVTYDIDNTSLKGQVFDVSCSSLTLSNGGAKIPTLTTNGDILVEGLNLTIKELAPTDKNYIQTALINTDVYFYGYNQDYVSEVTTDLDGNGLADWANYSSNLPIDAVTGISVDNNTNSIIDARTDDGTFASVGGRTGNDAFSFQVELKLLGDTTGTNGASWAYSGDGDKDTSDGSTFGVAHDGIKVGGTVVTTDSNKVYNHFRFAYIPSGNSDGRGDIYIYRNDQLVKVFRNRIGASTLTFFGDYSPTGIAGGYETTYIAFTAGAFAPEPGLTPVLGIDVTQNGRELTWHVDDEIDVKEYHVIDVTTGDVITVIEATGLETYSIQLPEGVLAKLVVVDNSGLAQTFYSENGDIRTVAYNLSEGWNLITITTEDADLTELTKAIAGELWVWDGAAYQVTTDPQPTQGVWVYAPNATEVTVSGTKSDAEMTIFTGWNLVGPVENSSAPVEATVIYNWNDIYESIATDQGVLLQGVGYWIFSF